MTTVWRGDANYEATRRRMVWNERIPQRFPDVIVSVTSDSNVIEAVKLARSLGLRVAVRAGGHGWIATSLRDGGMLIDLSRLNGVTVDAAARTAVAQTAIKNTELVAALAQHGLAFPAGHCPGETDLLALPNRAAESLAPGVWQRLQTIRQRHDPDGAFYGHIGQA